MNAHKSKHSRRVHHQRQQRQRRLEAIAQAMEGLRVSKGGTLYRSDETKFNARMKEAGYYLDKFGHWKRMKTKPLKTKVDPSGS